MPIISTFLLIEVNGEKAFIAPLVTLSTDL